MRKLNELLEEMPTADKKFYCREISNWDDDKKQHLEKLCNIFIKAGAKNPVSWAYSEVTEGISQIGRYLMLKNLFAVIKDPNCVIVDAAEYDPDIQSKINVVTEVLGEEFLNKMLYAYGKAIISGVISILDEGNYCIDNDCVNWCLSETDAHGKLTGRLIQGLHEDFYDFDE